MYMYYKSGCHFWLGSCIGTEKGKHSETSLHLVARYDNIDAVKYFIEELHIDSSFPDKGDCTPLYYASLRLLIIRTVVQNSDIAIPTLFHYFLQHPFLH